MSGVLLLVAEAWGSLPDPVVEAVVPSPRTPDGDARITDEPPEEPRVRPG